MKKIIIILAIILTIISMNKKQIPEESIRFRIIANSNSLEDQLEKRKIIKKISTELMNSSDSIKEERTYLLQTLPTFEEKVKEEMGENFTINYGQNYFPEKEYNGKKYQEGYYESLVITLGEGKGENFWCILFPPLCMIEDEDIEYKSIIKETILKFFA